VRLTTENTNKKNTQDANMAAEKTIEKIAK
jgi:hypothetical protein